MISVQIPRTVEEQRSGCSEANCAANSTPPAICGDSESPNVASRRAIELFISIVSRAIVVSFDLAFCHYARRIEGIGLSSSLPARFEAVLSPVQKRTAVRAHARQTGITEHIGCKSAGNGIDVICAALTSYASFTARLPTAARSSPAPRCQHAADILLAVSHSRAFFLSFLPVLSLSRLLPSRRLASSSLSPPVFPCASEAQLREALSHHPIAVEAGRGRDTGAGGDEGCVP